MTLSLGLISKAANPRDSSLWPMRTFVMRGRRT